MELHEFLTARYAEARAVEDSKWTIRGGLHFEWSHVYDKESDYVEVGPPKRRVPTEDFYREYGEPSPDLAVLADLDAKQEIVKLHGRLPLGEFCMTCDAPLGIPGLPYGCATLRLLALPYASHPDYREEWKP
ncbi:DUF6221 family protein [Streptomyces naphthomycinicus]|uniref:DUF6221 family protein n=1 Tax=Streptomyces naphthomycinicus TaxID=2872625 RepID=UPI001CEDDCF4|nr:DUF6221 family protein [Streptomyces sp. TML10]